MIRRIRRNPERFYLFLVFYVAFILISQSAIAFAAKELTQVVTIGALAKNRKEVCLRQWVPAPVYLNKSLHEYRFRIVPSSCDRFESAIFKRRGGFLAVSPSLYRVLIVYWKEIAGFVVMGFFLFFLFLCNFRLKKDNQRLIMEQLLKTEREDAELERRKVERLFSMVTEGFRDAVVIVNEAGIIVFCNREARKMFCGTEDSPIGKRLGDLVVPFEYPDAFEPELNALLKNKAESVAMNLQEFRKRYEPDDKSVLEGSLSRIAENGEYYVMGVFRDITERKEIENKLQVSETRLHTLINSTPDIICFKDGEGRWLEANAADLELFSLTDIDYRGKTDSELAEFVHPVYRKAFLTCEASDEKAWQSKVLTRGDEVIIRPDGKENVYDVIKVPVFDDNGKRKAMTVVGRDITEKKAVEQELIRSRGFLQVIIDSLPNEVLVVDSDYNIILSNKTAKDTWGIDAEVPALKCYEVFHGVDSPCDGDELSCPLRKVLSLHKPVSMQHMHMGRDGKARHVELCAAPVRDSDNAIKYMVKSSLDITDRILMEAQLRHSQKMEAIGELAAGIAHDFNNLLQVILGASEILSFDIPDASPSKHYVQEISGAARRSAELTRKLLVFSRAQKLELEYIDLNHVTKELLKLIHRVIGENIEISFSPLPNSAIIFADKGQVEQVLMNLCVNARDAMPDGGKLTLTISRENIGDEFVKEHPWGKKGQYIVVNVRDSGIGMDSVTVERIFEPFFTTKKLGNGTGLGLATVYGIMKQHKGMITVDSKPGSGSIFHVFFPVPGKIENNAGTKKSAGAKDFSGTVLLVEDDPGVRAISRLMLKRMGLDVVEGENVGEVLDLLEKEENAFSLVIIDLVLPKSSGSEMAEKIHEMLPDLPILFISGYSFNRNSSNSFIMQQPNFLKKPFTQDELREKIQALTLGDCAP